MSYDPDRVLNILKKTSSKYRGPGGAIAVLKDGDLVSQHVWGYADMDRRIPITPEVLFPICSITKQFAAALLFDLTQNPPPSVQGDFGEQMLKALREVLPSAFVDIFRLTVDNLVDMCSGLRDYWAVCTLQGSRPDTPYLLADDNPAMLRRIKTLHFEPGTQYSYSNTNFNILERLVERVTGESFAKLLHERILKPANMTTATLCPRTDRYPAPIIGYEGSEKAGFYPAPNFIEWSADAGMVASLTDMVAYEKYFDARYHHQSTNDNNSSSSTTTTYKSQIQPALYKNSSRSWYRYGLRHAPITNPTTSQPEHDILTISHGGALRGYRLMRQYVPSHRLSVVVLFNHMASAPEAAEHIIKQILDIPSAPTPQIPPAPAWIGNYLDDTTQLSVRITSEKAGEIKIAYTRTVETLKLDAADRGVSRSIEASVDSETGRVLIRRVEDNQMLHLTRLPVYKDVETRDGGRVQGKYHCDETESTFICEGTGDMLYALFDGPFGRGPPHLMTPLGGDVWVFANPRAMDDTPPGDWTVVFKRGVGVEVEKVVIGCWLARKLEFVRVS